MSILFNCAEPKAITFALQKVKDQPKLQEQMHKHGIVLGAYANRLTRVDSNWSMSVSGVPQPFRSDLQPIQYGEEFVFRWVRDFNIQIVGGCCGISPAHIAELHRQLKKGIR